MKKKRTAQSAFLTLCILLGLLVFFAGIVFALFAAPDLQPSVADRTPHHRAQLHTSEPSPVTPNGDVYEAWVARYNGTGNGYDEGKAVAVDNTGNVYVAGSTFGLGTIHDYATIKYDSVGQQQWVALFNDLAHPDEQLNAMTIDTSGNVYVTGLSGTYNIPNVCTTIKYNSAGQQQWIARYNAPNGAFGQAIVVDDSGNVYVAAGASNESNTLFSATIKYNAAGQQQWVAEYHGGSGVDEPAALVVDKAGNVYVTGTTQTCPGSDYLTLKDNSAGQEQWVARYFGPQEPFDSAKSIAVDNAGNVYVTGESFNDCATIKYNAEGHQQWAARESGGRGNAIAIDGFGNICVTGVIAFDYGTIKYNSAGQQQWLTRYNGPPGNGSDVATAIVLDSMNNVYVTGRSERTGPFSDSDYATVKYNSAGQQQWVVRYNGPGNTDDRAAAMAIDGLDNIYVTGISGSGNDADFLTIKYGQGPMPTPTATATASPTPTATGTATPTNTPTATATASPSPTPTATPTPSEPGGSPTPSPTATPTPMQTCCQYVTSTGNGSIIPGIIDIGNHCDNCLTQITFPFPVTFYNSTFTQANVSANGNLQFTGNDPYLGTSCPLPNSCVNAAAIFAYQTDLRTNDPNNGIFTVVTGTAPNRVFNVEWRTTYFDRTGVAHFEVRFYENQTSFDVVYGVTTDNGASEVSGVQLGAIGGPCDATTFSCHTPTLTNGLKVTYQLQPCGPPPPTPTASPTPTVTATPTGSPIERPTPAPRVRPSPFPRP